MPDITLTLTLEEAVAGGAGYLTAWASEPGVSYPYAGIGANINFSG